MAMSYHLLTFAITLSPLCAILVCSNVIRSFPEDRKQVKEWFAFTASFGKMSGNTQIEREDIDCFVQTEVMPKIDSFKIVDTLGVWKGQTEDSFDIFVLSDEFHTMMEKLQDICLKYKEMFAQESVLLFYEKAKVRFL